MGEMTEGRPDPRGYVRLQDETIWPDPLDPLRVEAALRNGEPTRDQLSVAASYIAAYRAVIYHTGARRTQIAREIQSRRPSPR